MSPVDASEVRRLADLAGLELSGDEAERLAREVGEMLRRLEELGELPGEAPEEEGELGLRPDTPAPDRLARPPGAMAPEWRDGFFVLPRLGSMGDEGATGGEGSTAGGEGEP